METVRAFCRMQSLKRSKNWADAARRSVLGSLLNEGQNRLPIFVAVVAEDVVVFWTVEHPDRSWFVRRLINFERFLGRIHRVGVTGNNQERLWNALNVSDIVVIGRHDKAE